MERSGGLPGFRRVMILESFQMAGMLAEEMERLKLEFNYTGLLVLIIHFLIRLVT